MVDLFNAGMAMVISGVALGMHRLFRPKARQGDVRSYVDGGMVNKNEIVLNADQSQAVEALQRFQRVASLIERHAAMPARQKRRKAVVTNCINCGAPLNGDCDHCGTKYS